MRSVLELNCARCPSPFRLHRVHSGLREIVRFLCQHRLVDCIVSTGGGIEEDFIKCLGPTKIGAC